ncbi:MAG: NUDIX hydrolase [Solirubrobacteraceae bacterium]
MTITPDSALAAGAARGPRVLARGPWPIDRVAAHWHSEHFEPSASHTAAADEAIAALKRRGSPSHDGLAGRLMDFSETQGALTFELQPLRWALRLVSGDASLSLAVLCVTRAADGRWLAGRRASWVASWPGRWGLGAAGAVDAWENPAETLVRELREEWSVTPERIQAEALVELPHSMAMFVGQAWLGEAAEVVPDAEHDAFAWWPADIDRWPDDAEDGVRRMARLLAA